MKDGLYCSGGKNWFSLGAEGSLHRCNALLYKGGYLGNILTEDVIVDTEFRKCPFQECLQVCDRHWAQKKVYKRGKVSDYEDIVEPMVFKGHDNPITLVWNAVWECNYDCQYCDLPSTEKYPSANFTEWIKGFNRFIKSNKITGGLVMCSGGEPMFMKGIEHVLCCLYMSDFRIAINTNLSHDLYKEIIRMLCGYKKVWPPAISFQVSLHHSEPSFNWDEFSRRVLDIRDKGMYVAVNIVAHPDHIESLEFYDHFFRTERIQFKVSPLVGYGIKVLSDYPPHLRKIVEKYMDSTVTDDNKFIDGVRCLNI